MLTFGETDIVKSRQNDDVAKAAPESMPTDPEPKEQTPGGETEKPKKDTEPKKDEKPKDDDEKPKEYPKVMGWALSRSYKYVL
jgi:hypothetical protein